MAVFRRLKIDFEPGVAPFDELLMRSLAREIRRKWNGKDDMYESTPDTAGVLRWEIGHDYDE
jgi:hypothetical protein